MIRLQGTCGFFAVILATAGCKVGPDPVRPETSAQRAEGFVNASEYQKMNSAPVGPWWEQFNDPVTNQLVQTALENNTDLKIAAARILESKALLKAAWGQRLPQLGAGAGYDRRKNSFTLPQIGRVGIYSTTYDVGLTASWQIDLFGKLARQHDAAWAEMLATEADREALLHTVIAEVVRLRARIATLGRRLEIARANTASWQITYDTVERRYKKGVATALEFRLARENLAATRAAEPQVEYLLRTAQHALDVLLGRQPGTGEPMQDTLSELPPVDPPPVGIPAALLDRRPDLKAAELRQAAATYQVGVAIANLYPDLNIAATGGYTADVIKDLFQPETKVYSLILDAAWRFFSGGTLRAQVKAARARAEAAAAQYALLVLNALREVEDALVREETARRSHSEVKVRLSEATAAENLARERYQRGVDRLILVLESERRRRLAQNELNLAQEALWDARIDLFLALGGDWFPAPEGEGNSERTDEGEQVASPEPAAEAQTPIGT